MKKTAHLYLWIINSSANQCFNCQNILFVSAWLYPNIIILTDIFKLVLKDHAFQNSEGRFESTGGWSSLKKKRKKNLKINSIKEITIALGNTFLPTAAWNCNKPVSPHSTTCFMRIRQTLQRSKKNVKALMIAHKRSQCTRIYKPRQLTLWDSAANSQHYPAPSFPHSTCLSLLTESGPSGQDTQMLSIKKKEVLKM